MALSEKQSLNGQSGTPLPEKISNPAKRGLASAGILVLEDLARFSKREVAALHGVGPTCMVLLDRKMAKAGYDYKP